MPMTRSEASAADRLRIVLTAGYDRSPQAVALFQLLLRDGHDVAAVLVVNPFDPRRALRLVRSEGVDRLWAAARKLRTGRDGEKTDSPSPIDEFFAANSLARTGLRSLCRKSGAPYRLVRDLNEGRSLEAVRTAGADGVLYCGGGILRTAFLEAAGGKVLNAHAGPLPEIRGMNAAEWCLLAGLTPELTVHFIDRGVDTGPEVGRVPIPVEPGDDISRVRERSIVAGIAGLLSHVGALRRPRPARRPDADRHPQYFRLADPVRAMLEERISRAEKA